MVDQAPEPREDEEIALGTGQDNVLRQAADGGRPAEAMLQEVISGRGSPAAIHRAMSRASRDSRSSRGERRNSIS